jgi:predicted GNAT family acetyltransferase
MNKPASTPGVFEVVHEAGDPRGRYVVYLPGGLEAELTYGRRDGRIVADHTYVPPSFRGHGIAERLVNALIADVRAGGGKVLPLCSYVAAQFRRHPDWSDLKA